MITIIYAKHGVSVPDTAAESYVKLITDGDEIMESQKDLVEIKVKLTPIANMKG